MISQNYFGGRGGATGFLTPVISTYLAMLPLGQILPDLYISSDCLIDSADHFEEILFSYIRSHSRRSLADLPEVASTDNGSGRMDTRRTERRALKVTGPIIEVPLLPYSHLRVFYDSNPSFIRTSIALNFIRLKVEYNRFISRQRSKETARYSRKKLPGPVNIIPISNISDSARSEPGGAFKHGIIRRIDREVTIKPRLAAIFTVPPIISSIVRLPVAIPSRPTSDHKLSTPLDNT
ncbi:hypothetical protein PCH_Pc16g07240 [Penicillium rubens Wisconsin 54-1255]|uniref:Uncharacterized protein n=1 Tax=Penicillium rubens (strain ATCC 28089 / DSM 1075 / NRRL 1951 / Wisconsin 54-1255) TaxID=500485 RepID=B6H7E2_PENRW|nr:hypothetical protein PCH_Pc16g07240 [Penicillium rubens Wisconsin 54-1255]